MRLTYYTDYSLRVLIFLALKEKGILSNIKEISEAYSISKNHLTKIIHELGKHGYIETIRGRNGGIRLKRLPEEINIGELVRRTEEDFYLLECFDSEKNTCVLSPACRLKKMLNDAMNAFFQELDQYTLADIATNKNQLISLLRANT
ncbi:Rrf2 family transcriptional regulator [Pueribacillus theae]|uniref:HTH-type transcriptional regulator NsrR n=1 Tax=Pueribacillus theae TaxID=2171751 RepID=A0A2U1K3V9_9BACI|nr:Rrf2 family transcriptional regulator [Pueribacillus theae]PWA12217.1 Rrf2 family transcriptional regulator [Pueribacillus theae]